MSNSNDLIHVVVSALRERAEQYPLLKLFIPLIAAMLLLLSSVNELLDVYCSIVVLVIAGVIGFAWYQIGSASYSTQCALHDIL